MVLLSSFTRGRTLPLLSSRSFAVRLNRVSDVFTVVEWVKPGRVMGKLEKKGQNAACALVGGVPRSHCL
jgi:hypothetical protein